MPRNQLGSQLSSPARCYLDAYKQRVLRPVSEVADMETLLGPAGRYVDPVVQHCRRHYVWLKLFPSGLLKMLLNMLVYFSLPKKAGAQRFIIDARQSNRPALLTPPPVWTVAHREGLCRVEFQVTPEDAQNWFVN